MSILDLRLAKRESGNGWGAEPAQDGFDRRGGLYPEAYFREMLLVERKRSERSRKPFMLVLIDIRHLTVSWTRQRLIRTLGDALAGAAREIDIRGWYEQDRVIGIIFAEFNEASRDLVYAKVRTSLQAAFAPEQMAKIEVSYCLFPDHGDEAGNPDCNCIQLYGDPRERLGRLSGLAAKRAIDIAGSLLGIIVWSPVLLAIAVLVKLTSKGPVLFRQQRAGVGGKLFTFLKFRSMYVNNDPSIHRDFVKKLIKQSAEPGDPVEATARVFKIQNDPRVTRIGRFLRKTSLDELPQLFNVLMGDMSLVGPRPAIPYEVAEYDVWHRRRVFEVKPGITGMWQVEGRSSTTFDNMVRMDIRYITNWSFLLDLKLLIKTPLAVLTAKGAY